MSDKNKLNYGKLTDSAVHICVDMQRMFAENTDWETPWMGRVVPKVRQIVEAHPSRTIFTRFIPAERPAKAKARGSAITSAGN